MTSGGIGSFRGRACALAIALLGAMVIGAGAAASSLPPQPAAVDAAAPMFPRLQIRMTFSYHVVGRVDKIRGISFTGLPLNGQVTVRCLGHCFTRRMHKNVLNFQQAVRFVRLRTFFAGQKLVFSFNAPFYTSVTFILKMIYNGDPKLSLYKPKPHHRR